MVVATAPFDTGRYLRDRAAFRREQVVLPSGRLYGDVEEGWQRENVWEPWDSGRFNLVYVEAGRGHGKSTLAAMAAIEWCLFEAPAEVVIVAGDADQAGIILTIMARIIAANAYFAATFEVQRDRVTVPATGTTCRVLSSDALTNFGLGGVAQTFVAICDELWVWQRPELWEAIISSTGKVKRWRVLVLSNAGILGQSTVAWKLRETARSGVDPEMHFWRADGPVASWVTPAWVDQQRRLLMPGAFRRLILNEWTEAASEFITPEEWDVLVAPLRAPWPDVRGGVVVGLDASRSAKRGADTTAAVALRRDGQQTVLVAHRIWEPKGESGDIDLRTTVLPFLLELRTKYGQVQCHYDPYNMSTLAQMGRESGLLMVETPQTLPRQAEFTQALLDAIRARALIVYPCPDLRQHVLNATLIETARGVRLAKEKSSAKVDGAVALAMAVHALTSGGAGMAHRTLEVMTKMLDLALGPVDPEPAGQPYDAAVQSLLRGSGRR